MQHRIAFISLVFVLAAAGFISGCATNVPKTVTESPLPVPTKGVYHKVQSGETIWRIAKVYGVTIDEIVKSNNIPDVAQIEKDQLVFIPNAEKVKEVVLDQEESDKSDFAWPIKGKILYYYGDRKSPRPNRGIDIQSSEGDTVRAAKGGRVVFADYLNGYGHTVIIDHGDDFFTVYSQNAKLLVKLHDAVVQGNPIAQLGKSGDLAYLHFEVRKNAVPDNPLYYLP